MHSDKKGQKYDERKTPNIREQNIRRFLATSWNEQTKMSTEMANLVYGELVYLRPNEQLEVGYVEWLVSTPKIENMSNVKRFFQDCIERRCLLLFVVLETKSVSCLCF